MEIGPLTPLPDLKAARDALRALLDPRNPDRPPREEIGAYYNRLVELESLVRDALETGTKITHLRYRSRT